MGETTEVGIVPTGCEATPVFGKEAEETPETVAVVATAEDPVAMAGITGMAGIAGDETATVDDGGTAS